jgi:S-(hydroxymethyl)glutathione dehydrogenase/alcohol dehydrogenase
MEVNAAVLNRPGEPLRIETLRLAPPQPGEVLVRLAASGVCRSDLSNARNGFHLPTPIVLGHEGAGIVEAVGPGVVRCAPGDHVVLSLIAQCGACRECVRDRAYMCEVGVRAQRSAALLDGTTRLEASGGAVHQFLGLGTFAEAVVVPDIAVVRIDADIDLSLAALLGCGVTTGLGAVFNTAPVAPADSVLVGGCGGVGMNVIQGAVLAGARHIIGIEPDESKWELAGALGATHMAVPADLQEIVRSVTSGRGVDVAYDLVGGGDTAAAFMDVLAPGGTLCLIGAKRGEVLQVPIVEQMILKAARIVGCNYGSAFAARDIPRWAAAFQAGRLNLNDIVSSYIPLEEINEALSGLDAGHAIRSVITYK